MFLTYLHYVAYILIKSETRQLEAYVAVRPC